MVARPSANGCHLKLKPFLAESHPHILGEGAVEDAHHCTLHSTHISTYVHWYKVKILHKYLV